MGLKDLEGDHTKKRKRIGGKEGKKKYVLNFYWSYAGDWEKRKGSGTRFNWTMRQPTDQRTVGWQIGGTEPSSLRKELFKRGSPERKQSTGKGAKKDSQDGFANTIQ